MILSFIYPSPGSGKSETLQHFSGPRGIAIALNKTRLPFLQFLFCFKTPQEKHPKIFWGSIRTRYPTQIHAISPLKFKNLRCKNQEPSRPPAPKQFSPNNFREELLACCKYSKMQIKELSERTYS